MGGRDSVGEYQHCALSRLDRLKSTLKIAEFVAALSLDDVPARAIEVAKGGMIDALGAAIAGTGTEAAQVVTRWAREVGGGAHAGIIGGCFKASPQTAARVNGTIGQALDFDPPNPLLPVLLAVGEFENSSGRDVLEAYVAGFEVQSKLQRGVSAKHYAHGWHSNAVFGTIGATAAAAKLLKLDAWQTCMAFGIAASEAGGLRQNLGTMTKPYHAGAAAANGIIAATLARHGMTSASDSLEGEFGLLNVFATHGEYNERQIAESFGAPWNLLAHEIRIKPYPCCRAAHRALDAILALCGKHRIVAQNVAGIECEASAHVTQLMAYPSASNALEAKFCLPVLSCGRGMRRPGRHKAVHRRACKRPARAGPGGARTRGAPGRQQRMGDREIAALHGAHSSLRRFGARKSVGPPRGDRENPCSMHDILEKYSECTRDFLSDEHSDFILAAIEGLESLPDLRVLADILTYGVQSMQATVQEA